MTLYQRFQQGDRVELLPVRTDKITSVLYTRLTDILRIFPDASFFRVNGGVLYYLEDENEQEPPVSLTGITIPQLNAGRPVHSPSLPSDTTEISLSDLSSRSFSSTNSSILTRSSTYSPSRSSPSFSSSSDRGIYHAVPIARSMAALSAIASDITHIQHQLDQSSDEYSEDHQQLLKQLVHLLQEQAAAKGREERILAELTAAKERDEEMLRLQIQTIDRLVVAQQHIDAVLVQNYELHEYPIPRLFVILPDSYERWDPRNVLAERFRLFFLCECGEHCSTNDETDTATGQLVIAAAPPTTSISAKNSIHLAKHEDYELTRPTDFLDQYGPYVLGTLRILKHCLAVAVVVSPAIALADNSVKDVMDGVKSLSESTMAAVDVSIAFCRRGWTEMRWKVRQVESELTRAELRRLDTFLRNKDADKVLGNLYRITTESGHVKWVCFDHYRQVYRETTMSSFLQCVESNGGTFDSHIGKVTVSLKSSLAAKDFFSRLTTQTQAVTSLKVVFDWSFGS
ncbi:MAG: hypothetical protein J3R72DRAFT_418338 [Linnemannia gamsii]|nr:MAG: hypothetical protein J3R72DRAFT_418338 [Linnemannia gamsii]